MYCPNCGANNSTEQRFCRSCGLNLEKTNESLLEQSANLDIISDKKISKFFETLGKLGFGGLIGAGAVGIIIVIITLIQKFVLSGQTDKIVVGLIFVAILILAILGLAYVIFQEYSKGKNKYANAQMQVQLEGKKTDKLLEENSFEPVLSITENTTDLLLVKNKTNKFE